MPLVVFGIGSAAVGALITWVAWVMPLDARPLSYTTLSTIRTILRWTARLTFAVGGGFLAIAAAVGLGLVGGGKVRAMQRIALLHGRYVVPHKDLDASGQMLLQRALAAQERVMRTRVYNDDAIDSVAHRVTLSALVWGLALELADLKIRSASLDELLIEAELDKAQVVLPAKSDIDRRRRDLEARVGTMEQHAQAVDGMDQHYRLAWVARRLDEHTGVDLAIAHAVRDPAESAEIARLADEVAAARVQINAEIAKLGLRFDGSIGFSDP